MEILLFVLPSLLVAAAYLAPVTEPKGKSVHLPVFGQMCGCRR